MINIRLAWPPTVNTYYTISCGRKILSKRGRAYKINSAVELLRQKAPRGLTQRIEVNIEAYPPDKRKRDIDNIIKPVLDCITDYGLWFDDEQIDVLRIRRRNVEKPGYIRIHISEIGE